VVDLLDPSRPSSAQHQNSPTKKFCLSSAGPAQDVLVLTSQCKRVAQCAVTQPCQRDRPQPSFKCSTPKLPNKKILLAERWTSPRRSGSRNPTQACRAACCDTVWSTCSTPAVLQVLNTKTPQQKFFCLPSAGPAQDVLVLVIRRKRVA
jgi:hypothetical protein